jgi:hypothetical protein
MRAVQILVAAVTLGLVGGYAWSALPRESAASGPAVAPRPTAEEVEHSHYYPNCAAAHASGHAPIFRGQPGYREKLDADGDGIACEPLRTD